LISIMDLLTWILVGLIAGVLASLIVGGTGYGLLGDLVVGMVGAIVGGWVFHATGWRAPFHGMASAIAVSFVGAALLLVVLHLFQRARFRS